MEIEMEVDVAKDELGMALERMNAAAGLLEQAVERFAGIELDASNASAREMSLERRLAEAEATIESLRAEAAARAGGRKTAPAAALVSREGVVADAGALDGALRSLSLEQRIAVKSEMLRAGLMG